MTVEIVEQSWLERAVHAFLAEFDYGAAVGPGWFEKHLEIQWPDRGTREAYKRVALVQFERMDALRSVLLEEHRMALRSMGKGAYHVVTPDEQHRFAMEQLRSGIERETRKAWRVIEYTDTEKLSDPARKAREEASAKLAAFEALAKRRLRGALPTAPALPACGTDAPANDDDATEPKAEKLNRRGRR